MNDLIEVGKIVNTHALKGELKFEPWCDDLSIFDNITQLFDNSGKAYTFTSIKPHKSLSILKLAEISSIEIAEQMKGTILQAKRSELGELPEGTYYLCDLLGINAYDENGELIGTLTDWMETGANYVYVLKNPQGKEILIPSIPEVVKEIDLTSKRMTVNLIEGLLD